MKAQSKAGAKPKAKAGAKPKPKAKVYKGTMTVGVLYFVDKGMASHNCTASVVHSPKGNLLLTAGHCANGSKYAFVPQYRTGRSAARQPHGIWAVDRVFKDPRRTTYGPGSDLDFAFTTVKPDRRGRQIEQVTGANKLTRTPGYRGQVTVIGYPSARNAPVDKAIKCRANTTRLPGYGQLRMECGGFHGGTSGSPWLRNFDERTGTGQVVGNLGGAGGGGASDDVSYAPYYDDEVFKLYRDAIDGVATVRRPPLPYSPGSGETWRHARHLASGEYTGDGTADLLVVWTDGEVTLHPGNGKGGFSGERRLKSANGTWKHATTVTGGDFTRGRGTDDLMVRWSDGEVTLYPDVSAAGLRAEVELAPARSTWKHATLLTAGRFTGNGRTDDLVVRWSDGEVTLYSEVNGRAFKNGRGYEKETRLQKPNGTWKHATLLTGGDFTGRGNWDLVVRWSDGERTLYQDLSASGLGKETRMQGPNARWKQAEAMTAGAYSANGRPDDLIVRWSDGEVTLYADTGKKLGAARTLVPPATR
ncbi:trypsin-like serine peptidase [Streptomyces flavofungini]|uniref:trypsin-like serine peptidase n=1 Tax=Streptomyces flavofungini TaxID=68200 RepID=UPI0025B03E41|nr:trypsin-like peptidase domain-containing protein [Streptomyces flavofungini]WJV46983.1 trypsin-like peptidase domain-containing protein [Streptomyces flavofungini]